MEEVQRPVTEPDQDLIREYSSGTFCRLCFSQIYELHRVFPTTGEPNKLLVKKIEFCTEIVIAFHSDHNAAVCTKCVALVEEFFRFKQLCNANERWLKIRGGDQEQCGGGAAEDIGSSQASPPMLTVEAATCGRVTDEVERISPRANTYNAHLKQQETSIETIEGENASEVTSTNFCVRARKSTSICHFAVKRENEQGSDIDQSSTSKKSEPPAEINSHEAVVGRSYMLVPGTGNRINKLYLIYQNYRYSNPSNDGKFWRCTHHANKCKAVIMLEKEQILELNNHYHNHPPPTLKPQSRDGNAQDAKSKKNVKISLILKKEKTLPRRASRSCNQLLREQNQWFIKANRKTVDGFTYAFCGLRKDGVIRLKCITKACRGSIHMYSNGDLVHVNKDHCHEPHATEME